MNVNEHKVVQRCDVRLGVWGGAGRM